MRFLFNVHGYAPAFNVGGPIHSVSALAEGLVQRGHEVFVAASDWNVTERLSVDPDMTYERNGVRVRYFRAEKTMLQRSRIPYFAKSGFFKFGKDFRAWLQQHGTEYDVFHTQITYLSSTPLFSATARNLRRLYCFHQRGNLDPVRLQFRALKKRIYIRLFELPAMRRADVLFALTAYEVQTYRHWGLQNRSVVLANGVSLPDANSTKTPPLRNPELAKALAGPGDQPVFAFLARLHPLKGADLFAKAFLSFAAKHSEGIAILAGPDECGIEQWLAPAMAGVRARLHFVGPVTGDDKAALLRRTDCLVLPTASEGLSMTILEAMAAGCAVVTTPGAHFDEIETSGAGLIVDRSIPGVLGGLEEMARLGKKGMRAMGTKAVNLVRTKYSWGSIVAQYEAICQEQQLKRYLQ